MVDIKPKSRTPRSNPPASTTHHHTHTTTATTTTTTTTNGRHQAQVKNTVRDRPAQLHLLRRRHPALIPRERPVELRDPLRVNGRDVTLKTRIGHDIGSRASHQHMRLHRATGKKKTKHGAWDPGTREAWSSQAQAKSTANCSGASSVRLIRSSAGRSMAR